MRKWLRKDTSQYDPSLAAVECTDRMSHEVNSNAASEFDPRGGIFYMLLDFTLTFCDTEDIPLG